MPKPKRSGRAKRPRTGRRPQASVPALERRLARLVAAREADARRHARRVAALQRASDRRLSAMMQEIARLRHHEARVEALTRLVAERDAVLAALRERVALLEHPASSGPAT